MMNMMTTRHKQNKFDKAMDAFMHRHPCASFLALLIGMPLFILAAVFGCSTVIMLPIALIMGWI